MQYVYILESKQGNSFYVGCTNDLKERVKLHNSKKVQSTKNKTPFTLIHYEAYMHPKDAYKRERFLKTGWGKSFIRKNMKNYLIAKNFGG